MELFLTIIGALVLLVIGYAVWFLVDLSKIPRQQPVYIMQVDEEPLDDSDTDILKPKLTESYLTLEHYIGQRDNVEYLMGHVNKAKEKDIPLPHIILWGSGGLGKSTLVKAVAYEMGGRFFELVPANLRNSRELFGIFFKKECKSCGHHNPYSATKCMKCKSRIVEDFEPIVQLQDKDVVFLEECHGLKDEIEEALYSLMQDGYMVIRCNGVDRRVNFPDITVAGATTQLGDLNKPFRDRFKINIQLKPYSIDEISEITRMYAGSQGLTVEDDALKLIAHISYGTPRVAKKYVSDASTLASHIEKSHVQAVLNLLNVDSNGLDDTHRAGMNHILERMKARKNGGAGSSAIASSCGIPKAVWEELYEPALLYHNLIFMSSSGRRLTDKAVNKYYAKEKANIK